MKKPIFDLVEDRMWDDKDPKIVKKFRGTEDECLEWILENTIFSTEEALERQGYKMIELR